MSFDSNGSRVRLPANARRRPVASYVIRSSNVPLVFHHRNLTIQKYKVPIQLRRRYEKSYNQQLILKLPYSQTRDSVVINGRLRRLLKSSNKEYGTL